MRNSASASMQREPRALFLCGSMNQTTQLHAVAKRLPELRAYFTPFYGAAWHECARRFGLLDRTILGRPWRRRCLEYLRDSQLSVDVQGRDGPYDLIVTCTDLLIPPNVRGRPLVLVQEGMTDPETPLSRFIAHKSWIPAVIAGTALSGVRGRYDRFCVASEGYRELFVQRGAPADKLRVTGIPNFDDCARFRDNGLTERGYVLVCTSDMRETFSHDDRPHFLRQCAQIAAGRPLHFRFHPNENVRRAQREVEQFCPSAIIHPPGVATEHLIANCDVLVTQLSSVVYVGLALGKEVHSYFDLEQLKRLLPIQNGGRSADNIADVCRELLGASAFHQATKLARGSHEADAWAS